jgi:tetratricopeptide (TPR) repeat protein
MLVPRCSSDRRTLRHTLAAITMPLLMATVSITTLSAQAPALTGAARWADTVRVSIERAVTAGDMRALTAAGALAQRALTAFPNDPLLLHYRGYGIYRELMMQAGERTPAYKERMEEAVTLFEQSAAVRPMAETQALLSTCLGNLAAEGMIAGMRYGPASSEARDAALQLGPRNPRVLLLTAVSYWFTPKMWGGGEDKGYATLQRAIAAFATDAPAAPLPAWGHAEAYAWLGQMEVKRGNPAAARAAYAKALSLEPNFVWVRQVLLPAVAQR